jgi:hypothetical protein
MRQPRLPDAPRHALGFGARYYQRDRSTASFVQFDGLRFRRDSELRAFDLDE